MKYPFTPEVLDGMPEGIAELYRGLELQLLDEICSRLNLAGELNEVTVDSIRALRSQGISLDEIEKAIRQSTNISEKELKALLDDVVARNQEYYTDMIDLAGLTQPQTLVSAKDVDAIIRQTGKDMLNITQSMGFLVDGGRTMLEPAKAYQWALNNAEMQIMSGAISYNQAVKSSIRQLADSGLRYVTYESGHRDHIDVAARRAVMTGINQLCSRYSEQSMDYLNTDLVETTAHSGARNIGGVNGWEAHTEWQGKVFHWRAKGNRNRGKYPDFERSCGYGDVTGILGANCRHFFHPFIDGVMERTYSDRQLRHIDDGRDADFEGRHYTAYEATQKQREIERTVRKLERRSIAFEAQGNTEEAQAAQAQQRRLRKKYREFSKAADLPLQTERMRIT